MVHEAKEYPRAYTKYALSKTLTIRGFTFLELLHETNHHIVIFLEREKLSLKNRQRKKGFKVRIQPKSHLIPPWQDFMPLKTSYMEVFLHIREKGLLRMPHPLRAPLSRRNMENNYHFHQDHEHDTEET